MDGNHFTDMRTGQPVVLRGFDIPIGMQGAQLAVTMGANMVRIPVPWSTIEPTAPVGGVHTWSTQTLSALDSEVTYLQQHNVEVLIDFHQVHWSPYFANVCDPNAAVCGGAQGIPGWYYADHRYPATQDGLNAAQSAFFTTEAEQSAAAYGAFAQMMVARYSAYPNVVGYEIMNEPAAGDLGTRMSLHKATTAILQWQSLVLTGMREVDPVRAAFISCRGGGEGIGTADFGVFHHDPHLVLDFHDFYNGVPGTGFDLAGDNWVPNWHDTHNQFVTDYQGTLAAQQEVLMVAIRRAAQANIPLYVGEWGARFDDVNAAEYQSQMLSLFDAYGVSWTRWMLNSSDRFRLLNGRLPNSQAVQVSSALATPPSVTSFQGLPLLGVTSLAAGPTPVRKATTISFALTRPATVTVTITHFTGGAIARHLKVLRYSAAGEPVQVVWKRRNDTGTQVVAGLYVIKVDAVDTRGERVERVRLIRVLSKV
ncbi:MAG: glycoside hydrolase family 5 protein [Gaiellales bacterium]